ncbi:RNA polymerase sigma factor [Candidatus Uabimicrobium amorphum]|uniref:RNA polymerase sigma factor 70 region 4 type 2 domain-containing protein n=1 Tax=Uabimicrobium amorphum TaxID=2596890 RepID=A0A5S9IPC2_UABAM|nr:sigma factor-like helix-turn-helix DNA-binding protein [Candidatus Uabimicrobium amorphum]BBM84225.1 hypothetical protein UABAM_02581 [Candidatus Uabimicrobium amorphum]
MDNKHAEALSKISTQWTTIESILEQDGPKMLGEYLATKYCDALAKKLVQYRSRLNLLDAHSIVSDILYEFIKNDYKNMHTLSRDRGHLRGLFFTIIKRKLSKLHSKKLPESWPELADQASDDTNRFVSISCDLEDALQKMQDNRPLLYQPFVSHYLEGKKISEIAQQMNLTVDAVKKRLQSSRKVLAEYLDSYQEKPS